ncbi:hypothetical protein ACFVAJ_17540 [Agromyces sp. NPDC057679]|uniref:hypothetical protein n=1 Tax=Agromyces sp. NPDC057679 TaxID=3346207 RepID=UPI0036730528
MNTMVKNTATGALAHPTGAALQVVTDTLAAKYEQEGSADAMTPRQRLDAISHDLDGGATLELLLEVARAAFISGAEHAGGVRVE